MCVFLLVLWTIGCYVEFLAKQFCIICLNRVAMLRSHHHLRAFLKLSLVGCLLRQRIYRKLGVDLFG